MLVFDGTKPNIQTYDDLEAIKHLYSDEILKTLLDSILPTKEALLEKLKPTVT